MVYNGHTRDTVWEHISMNITGGLQLYAVHRIIEITLTATFTLAYANCTLYYSLWLHSPNGLFEPPSPSQWALEWILSHFPTLRIFRQIANGCCLRLHLEILAPVSTADNVSQDVMERYALSFNSHLSPYTSILPRRASTSFGFNPPSISIYLPESGQHITHRVLLKCGHQASG